MPCSAWASSSSADGGPRARRHHGHLGEQLRHPPLAPGDGAGIAARARGGADDAGVGAPHRLSRALPAAGSQGPLAPRPAPRRALRRRAARDRLSLADRGPLAYDRLAQRFSHRRPGRAGAAARVRSFSQASLAAGAARRPSRFCRHHRALRALDRRQCADAPRRHPHPRLRGGLRRSDRRARPHRSAPSGAAAPAPAACDHRRAGRARRPLDRSAAPLRRAEALARPRLSVALRYPPRLRRPDLGAEDPAARAGGAALLSRAGLRRALGRAFHRRAAHRAGAVRRRAHRDRRGGGRGGRGAALGGDQGMMQRIELPEVERAVHGLRLRGHALYLQPRGRPPLGFLAHARGARPVLPERTVATAATIALLESAQPRALRRAAPLSASWGQSFALGSLRLTVHPAGHVLGSAQLRCQADGLDLVYAADIGGAGTRASSTAEPREQLTCETLVIRALYGSPRYVFAPREELLERARAFVEKTRSEGRTPVLIAAALGAAQD